jgi:putative hydrolase of HD superfamily
MKRKNDRKDIEAVLDLIAEAGKLKYVKRSGWWMLGIPREESVADHSFRSAAIGYMLAVMEGVDAGKVLLMALFNDIHEARINDQHKVAHKYLDVRKAEKKAFAGQIKDLPASLRNRLGAMRLEYDSQKTIESLIARDADILECLLQCKEYVDQGFASARKFFRKGPKLLATETAKKLWKITEKWDSNAWWEKLGEFER